MSVGDEFDRFCAARLVQSPGVGAVIERHCVRELCRRLCNDLQERGHQLKTFSDFASSLDYTKHQVLTVFTPQHVVAVGADESPLLLRNHFNGLTDELVAAWEKSHGSEFVCLPVLALRRGGLEYTLWCSSLVALLLCPGQQ